MKTHYRLFEGSPASACGLSHPINLSRNVEEVDCPSCIAWINKNLHIRTQQLKSRQLPQLREKGGSNV